MQGDNKHPHINKSGSFSRLRYFELNDMGFSLNKISPITFDVKNSQTPADHGIKGRAPTSTPRERRVPQSTQQEQAHNEAADLNEAHHEPRGNASCNPDESITNKHVQGRFIPPKGRQHVYPATATTTVIIQGRQQRKYHPQWTKTPKRKKCSGSSFRPSRQCATRTGPYSPFITNWRTTLGSPSQQSE